MDINNFIKEQAEMINEIRKEAFEAGYQKKEQELIEEQNKMVEAMYQDSLKKGELPEEIMSPKDMSNWYNEG